MNINNDLETAINRVQIMEQYLDDVLHALEQDRKCVFVDPALQIKISELSDYYSSGTWLDDYDRDSRNEFPAELKRGILAQDTLYNLFMDLIEGELLFDD